jgi:hypothetical protein
MRWTIWVLIHLCLWSWEPLSFKPSFGSISILNLLESSSNAYLSVNFGHVVDNHFFCWYTTQFVKSCWIIIFEDKSEVSWKSPWSKTSWIHLWLFRVFRISSFWFSFFKVFLISVFRRSNSDLGMFFGQQKFHIGFLSVKPQSPLHLVLCVNYGGYVLKSC